MDIISGEEFARRMRVVSQLRTMGIILRRAALEAYEEGRSPYKPAYDIRSDYEYWKKLSEEKAREEAADPL